MRASCIFWICFNAKATVLFQLHREGVVELPVPVAVPMAAGTTPVIWYIGIPIKVAAIPVIGAVEFRVEAVPAAPIIPLPIIRQQHSGVIIMVVACALPWFAGLAAGTIIFMPIIGPLPIIIGIIMGTTIMAPFIMEPGEPAFEPAVVAPGLVDGAA